MVRNELLEARKQLIMEVKRDLMGPGSEYSIPDEEHEIITDLPEERYSVGILFPQNNSMDADNDDTISATHREEMEFDREEDIPLLEKEGATNIYSYLGANISEDTDVHTLDEEISLSAQNLPSSLGYTFFVDSDVDNLSCDLRFGIYRKISLGECRLPFSIPYEDYAIPDDFDFYIKYDAAEKTLRLKNPLSTKDISRIYESDRITDDYFKDCAYRLCTQFRKGFIRIPKSVPLLLKFDNNGHAENEKIDVDCSLSAKAIKRKVNDKLYSVTVMLVNTEKGYYNGSNSIFQPVLIINSSANDFHFLEYSQLLSQEAEDAEELSLSLLYRGKKVYATGHGTAMDWNVDIDGHGDIWNEFIPLSEVPQIDFSLQDKTVHSQALSMMYLSDLSDSNPTDKISSLRTLVNSYDLWIKELEKINLEEKFSEKAHEHICNCKETLHRINNGIRLLEENSTCLNAFLLANRAMLMQRIHSKIQSADHYPDDENLWRELKSLDYRQADRYYDNGQEPTWRPFQLAFLLMSLQSIIDPECNERELVDLIWFPTGGGKTEAYLGLTAFTIFYRRLKYPGNSNGTSVIMRYTLRLLASQQFIRASTLICACEAIRKDCIKDHKYPKYSLGDEEISIGLWIGGNHTPNKNSDAKENWDKLNKSTASSLRDDKDKYNKFQMLKCPWCGTKLVPDLSGDRKKLVGKWGYMFRKNHFFMACTQEKCVFEKRLPIQVVDQELYEKPPTLLFGTVDKFAMLPWKDEIGAFFGTNSENKTPELIIQDELHLISGPLGTIVGLYETAIDALCSAKGSIPKVVASTATIRRAKDQCAALYNREVKQFPPQGLNVGDSYFAREASLSERPGRLYVGIMPAGKTKAMMEVRAISSILQRTHMLDASYEVKDKYWTLAIYFNSLRDLGKCANLIDDDVKDFIRRIAYRFGTRKKVRQIGSADELTSRISTSRLNETLEKLEFEYSEENQSKGKFAISTLLATNMISVGVDVSRLNVMLIVGQPKLTSEYIQASSRIGRTYPGVAFVLYDGSKSRDRSHYEQFKAYHESFYRYVEPTGVTPFSKPARDRALHAVLISLIRHLCGLPKDGDAFFLEKEDKKIKKSINYIVNRSSEINERLQFQLSDESEIIEGEMEEFINEWVLRAEKMEEGKFIYGHQYMTSMPPADIKRLIRAFGSGGKNPDVSKETLLSMRNVDQNIAANILVWEESK